MNGFKSFVPQSTEGVKIVRRHGSKKEPVPSKSSRLSKTRLTEHNDIIHIINFHILCIYYAYILKLKISQSDKRTLLKSIQKNKLI